MKKLEVPFFVRFLESQGFEPAPRICLRRRLG